LQPDDPLVQSKIVLHNVFPNERQKWIEKNRDTSTILLKDPVRGYLIEIPIDDGQSRISADNGSSWNPLYSIKSSTKPRVKEIE
jgi:hypothetical protein